MNKKHLLTALYNQGKPLAEITIALNDGNEMEAVIEMINALGPDIEVKPGCYNIFAVDQSKRTIEGDATSEALERLFGWRIARVQRPKWDAVKGEYDGFWEDRYFWVEVQPPQFLPESLQGRIASMGLSQPGTNDNGNQDLITYTLPE